MFYLDVCTHSTRVPNAGAGQKALDPLELDMNGCEPLVSAGI